MPSIYGVHLSFWACACGLLKLYTWYAPEYVTLRTPGQRGRPVRTKSRQNESLFRSNGTHVFVLLGFRSDGISYQRDRALQRAAY